MRNTYEPGQDIKNFSKNLAKMDCRIFVTGSSPIDISTLVATALDNCGVISFNIKDAGLKDLVNSNPKALSVDYINRTLQMKFWSLKSQGLWSPAEIHKVDMKGEMDGLNLGMNRMVETQKRGQTGGNGRSQDIKARDLIRITCF